MRDLSRADPAAVTAEQARLLRLGLQLPLFDLLLPDREGDDLIELQDGDHGQFPQ